jgi:hypothetical protein
MAVKCFRQWRPTTITPFIIVDCHDLLSPSFPCTFIQMSSEIDTPCRRIPTLVHYCRRVATVHVDGIVSLGDTLSFELVRPILESCTADNLRRLESATPHLRAHTNDLWRDLCFKEYQVEAEEYSSGSLPPPKSWRDLFFGIRAMKEERFELLRARMKTQRLEAEKHKREKEIKITDRLPPMKRARGCESCREARMIMESFISVQQGPLLLSRRVCSRRPAVKPRRFRGPCSSHACDPRCQRPRLTVNASGMLFQSRLLRPNRPPVLE